MPGKNEKGVLIMICKTCGKNNPDGRNSCSSCGAPLIAAVAPGMMTASHVTFHAANRRKLNLLGLFTAVLTAVSIFLPFARIADDPAVRMSRDSTNSYWIFALLAAAAGAVFSCLGINAGLLLSGAAAVIMGILEYRSFRSLADPLGVPVHLSAGCIMLFAGGAVMVICAVYSLISARRK